MAILLQLITLMILITLTHGRYGLGQTYEILTMYYYALYYYRKATALRPYDARMWCAMAGCYKHLGRTTEAIKCYQRAETSGDREGIAFTELARLFKDQGTHPNPNLNRPRLHASAHHGAPYASAHHGAPYASAHHGAPVLSPQVPHRRAARPRTTTARCSGCASCRSSRAPTLRYCL